LPDGSKVTVEVEELDAGGTKIKAIAGKIENNKVLAGIENLGLASQARLFVADEFAGIHWGGDKATVERLVATKVKAPPAEMFGDLPPLAVADLAGNHVSTVLHVPLDALASDAFVEQASAVAGVFRDQGSESANEVVSGILRALASLSSVTVWVRHEGPAMTLRVAVQPFASTTTEEGKAAAAAVGEFLSGKSAAEVFGSLADAHAGSSRASSYGIRAGREPVKARNGAFMAVVLTATVLFGLLAPKRRAPRPAPKPPTPQPPAEKK
jgi:hypothetical protein